MYILKTIKEIIEGECVEMHGLEVHGKYYGISSKYDVAKGIIDRMNKGKLSQVHILEYIYDEII